MLDRPAPRNKGQSRHQLARHASVCRVPSAQPAGRRPETIAHANMLLGAMQNLFERATSLRDRLGVRREHVERIADICLFCLEKKLPQAPSPSGVITALLQELRGYA